MKNAIKAAAAFDDLVSEDDVIQKLGYSKSGLKYLRKTGRLKYTSLNGRKVMYFKSDLAEKLNLLSL